MESLGQYGIAKLACNPCTGRRAVEKMLETGLPVMRGTARNGSQNELFVGNGDLVEFAWEIQDQYRLLSEPLKIA